MARWSLARVFSWDADSAGLRRRIGDETRSLGSGVHRIKERRWESGRCSAELRRLGCCNRAVLHGPALQRAARDAHKRRVTALAHPLETSLLELRDAAFGFRLGGREIGLNGRWARNLE